MAISEKSLKNLIPAKKGEIRNPLGGQSHNPILKAVKRLAAHEVAEIGTLVLSKNYTALKDLLTDAKNNPNSKHSGLKIWIAGVVVKGISKGDAHALDTLLNRLIGKVKERVELSGQEGGPIRALVGAMTPEERKIELDRLRRIRSEAGED